MCLLKHELAAEAMTAIAASSPSRTGVGVKARVGCDAGAAAVWTSHDRQAHLFGFLISIESSRLCSQAATSGSSDAIWSSDRLKAFQDGTADAP